MAKSNWDMVVQRQEQVGLYYSRGQTKPANFVAVGIPIRDMTGTPVPSEARKTCT
jgi:hypothetical protein